jgi:structure-specific recognition protein 1
VLNSNIAGKTEVSLEFAPTNQEKKGKARPMDELVEIRFYVPGTHVKADDSDDEGKVKKPKKKKEGEDGAEGSEESEEEEEEESAAQRFHSQVRERATVSTQSSADAVLVSFDNILISTPRGRYGMDMYANYMRYVFRFSRAARFS